MALPPLLNWLNNKFSNWFVSALDETDTFWLGFASPNWKWLLLLLFLFWNDEDVVDEADEDSNAAGVSKSGSVLGEEGSESESEVDDEQVDDSSPDDADDELPAADECEDRKDLGLSVEPDVFLLGSFLFFLAPAPPPLPKLKLDERM